MSTYECIARLEKALRPTVRTPGFRYLIVVPEVKGLEGPSEKIGVVDLSISKSPILGMGRNHEEATTDALERKGAIYAYVLELTDYSEKVVASIRKQLWDYNATDIMPLPGAHSVAVSTKVSVFDLRQMLKKLKTKIARVTMV
jgi:hypothetical protein